MLKKSGLKLVAAATLAAGLAVSAAPGTAQAAWPEKPLKMFVGFAAGGGTDIYARIVASLIHEEIGQPMVVINKTGAASMIALKHVAEQDADGYTVLMQAVGPAITKELEGESPIKFRKDLVSIGTLGTIPAMLATPYETPYKTAKEFFDFAKKNPGKLRWSHAGRGGLLHLAGEKAFKSIGVDLKDVPFKGGADSKAAVVAAQVDAGLMNIQHYDGFETKLRVLGIFDDQRDPKFKDLPTLKELGYNVPAILSPFGVYVRTGTPADAIKKLQDALKKVVASKGYKRLIAKASLKDNYLDPAASEKLVEDMFKQLAK